MRNCAIEWDGRAGFGEHPTTAIVRAVRRISSIFSGSFTPPTLILDGAPVDFANHLERHVGVLREAPGKLLRVLFERNVLIPHVGGDPPPDIAIRETIDSEHLVLRHMDQLLKEKRG